jgi:hypothetical protein
MQLDSFTEIILSLNKPVQISSDTFWDKDRLYRFDSDLHNLADKPTAESFCKYMSVENRLSQKNEEIAISEESLNGIKWRCFYWRRNQIYRRDDWTSVKSVFLRLAGDSYGFLGEEKSHVDYSLPKLQLEDLGIFSEEVVLKFFGDNIE